MCGRQTSNAEMATKKIWHQPNGLFRLLHIPQLTQGKNEESIAPRVTPHSLPTHRPIHTRRTDDSQYRVLHTKNAFHHTPKHITLSNPSKEFQSDTHRQRTSLVHSTRTMRKTLMVISTTPPHPPQFRRNQQYTTEVSVQQ